MIVLLNLVSINANAKDELSEARREVFHAQRDLGKLYFAEYKLGKIFLQRGDLASAQLVLSQAYEHLEWIREDLEFTQEDEFKIRVKPVYYTYADVLLQLKQSKKARDVIEAFKGFELTNHFQDNCASGIIVKKDGTVVLADGTPLADRAALPNNTAVLHPIILPNRLELLLTLSDGIPKQFSTPISKTEIKRLALELNQKLQEGKSTFKKSSKKLYEHLIKPIEKTLNQFEIKTLVFVPDGILRIIPISSLLNKKKQFLIEKYAVATTPSFSLINLKPLPNEPQIMLNGLSKKIADFPALKHVPKEIDAIAKFMSSDEFLDAEFELEILEQNLTKKQYDIVHIATHAQFKNSPKETFILTHNELAHKELNLDQLECLLQDNPVNLLTLSACQSAKGDERAALGLAGVAVKAGAKSALATLWSVSDKSTAILMETFYKGLAEGLSKAEALRQAQLQLRKNKNFQYPKYWAPFLLIGNWL